ncbi:MAG: IclR family transcriptional regulator [Nereida ignava]|jgi:IclR family acetate operon transcriptional repressor
MPDDASHNGQIPTNLRLLLLLEAVVSAGVPITPSVIGESLGLPKPTVHRLIQTAVAEGFLQSDIDGRSYGPGPRLRSLALGTLSSQRVRTERLRVLGQLAEEVGETCNIALPDRDGMVYLDRVETHWPLRIQLPAGSQVPFHCTASGKMYLSSLYAGKLDRLLKSYPLEKCTDRTLVTADALKKELLLTAKRGFATDDQEFMDGMAAIAVAIRGPQGRLVSTLSLHAPIQRGGLARLQEQLEPLRAAAGQLEELLTE